MSGGPGPAQGAGVRAPPPRQRLLAAAAPALFVSIWSTGFVVARAVSGEVDPNLFLVVRFALTAVMFAAVARAGGAPWPRGANTLRHLLAGSLLQGVYLCTTYWAVANGLPASVMALLGALQPLFVALLARAVLGERVARLTWAGLLVGLAGVALVIAPRLVATGGGWPPQVVAAGLAGILSLTVGTLVQKTSLAAADLRSASAIQNAGAGIVAVLAALALGERHWGGGMAPVLALLWASIVLSGAGTTLLVWMVRRGNATRASALLLLAPPLVAVQTFLLFGETLTPVQLAGFAVALGGVWLARRPGQRR